MDPTGMEQQVFTSEQLRAVLDRITFKHTVLDFDWRFEAEYFAAALARGPQDGWLVWVTFERPDTLTGAIGRGRGRQELVTCGSTVSAVVKTAWLLVELMVRHELMEGFRFDGYRIFNPHNSVIDLADLQRRHDDKVARGEQ